MAGEMQKSAEIGSAGRLPAFRRIVTTHDSAGRSIIHSDERLAMQGPPGYDQGAVDLWATDPGQGNDGEAVPATSRIPGPGGTSFVIVQFPPESDIEKLPPELRKLVTASPAEHVPGLIKADTTRHFGMHYSETIDYGIVLSGEITMLLDEGEVTLRPGDTVVQRGTAHAWANRGREPAVMAVVVLGVEPMVRSGG